jgi:hypothetical protein
LRAFLLPSTVVQADDLKNDDKQPNQLIKNASMIAQIAVGRSAIQEFWKGALAMGIKSYKGELVEAEFFGDTGYLVGTYKLSG